MKAISVLGSTGSIGKQTLDVVQSHPDKFKIVALSGKDELDEIKRQLQLFKPKLFSVENEEIARKVEQFANGTEIVFGGAGLDAVATVEEADTVVGSLVGFLGLKPVLKAIQAGKNIALANKETLVAAGELVMEEVQKHNVLLTPIDSEHSALFQCLHGENKQEIKRLVITCSGGPFKFKQRSELKDVTVEQALGHPTWNMGAKITIDSSTLMNKGLEVIEAHWLYGVSFDKIDTILHPQSIVHSMVEFVDGSVMAQLGTHDMRTPIQYALSYPERFDTSFPRLDFEKNAKLEFYPIDRESFPSLSYAYEAGQKGGTLPCAMNAANEEAVYAFLKQKIGFLDIDFTVRKVMDAHKNVLHPSIEDIFEADKKAREETRRLLEEIE
ncbi:MAG: 1-deoxy-D-xylulose-5-phosphate reductoisomerase [Candidatus Diapherotrites archaeon]